MVFADGFLAALTATWQPVLNRPDIESKKHEFSKIIIIKLLILFWLEKPNRKTPFRLTRALTVTVNISSTFRLTVG